MSDFIEFTKNELHLTEVIFISLTLYLKGLTVSNTLDSSF